MKYYDDKELGGTDIYIHQHRMLPNTENKYYILSITVCAAHLKLELTECSRFTNQRVDR